jgi:hypothetical protein
MSSDEEIAEKELREAYGEGWEKLPDRIKQKLIYNHARDIRYRRIENKAKEILKTNYGIDPEAEKKLRQKSDEIMQMIKETQKQIAQIQWDLKWLDGEEKEKKEKELQKLGEKLRILQDMHKDIWDAYFKIGSIINDFIRATAKEIELNGGD